MACSPRLPSGLGPVVGRVRLRQGATADSHPRLGCAAACNHTADCRLVTVEEDRVYGWAALSPFSRRPVYQGVAEASVYVERSRQGRGLGTQLLENLIRESERRQYWTLLAKIFPENEPSLGLARGLGFREVGALRRIGKLNGVWRDVVLFERRSSR